MGTGNLKKKSVLAAVEGQWLEEQLSTPSEERAQREH
jgi:hypothetical protein